MNFSKKVVVKNFSFVSSCQPYLVELPRGLYFVELWGAGGGYCHGSTHAGRGAYTSGFIHLYSKQKFYVYIGQRGQDCSFSMSNTRESCNGGASGGKPYSASFTNGASGGGSTSIQLSSEHTTRIMVAAGGGGAAHLFPGGDAGDLTSLDVFGKVNTSISKGAGQEYGYSPLYGEPGRNWEQHNLYAEEGGGGGGGGYYGGYSYQGTEAYSDSPGAGGSSYISGHAGCKKRADFYFFKTKMASGKSSMKSYSDVSKLMTGNSGDGYAIITGIYFSSVACSHNLFEAALAFLLLIMIES